MLLYVAFCTLRQSRDRRMPEAGKRLVTKMIDYSTDGEREKQDILTQIGNLRGIS